MVSFKPGDEIGSYRVVRALGKGGMGAVYEVEDIPPETVAEIISRATSRISAKNAPRLYSQYRLAKALVKAKKDMPRLEASLKKRPLNFAARREYAELLALTGDWKGALAQFAELKGKEASMRGRNLQERRSLESLEISGGTTRHSLKMLQMPSRLRRWPTTAPDSPPTRSQASRRLLPKSELKR